MFWSEKRAAKTGRNSGFIRCFTMLLAVCVWLTFDVVTASAQNVGTYAVVDARVLNLRAAPSTGSPVIGKLRRGTIVSILDRKGVWARVFVQGADGKFAEGWLSTRFLGRSANTIDDLRAPAYDAPRRRSGRRSLHRGTTAPLRVSKLDFDCRPALFGNSGIRKCAASVRVQLSAGEYDPGRTDSVLVACRGVISYRTENDRFAQRMFATERRSIARNDRLGQTVMVNFDVRAIRDKIVSAQLRSYTCMRL